MFIIIAVAFVSGFLEAIKNDTPHTSGDASVSEPVKSDKKSNGDYEIILQNELPVSLSYADYMGGIKTTWSVTDLRYETTDYRYKKEQDVHFFFSGEKTYDIRGPGQGDSCRISWQLFDADGYVVDSGTCYSPNVREGEKFKDALSISYNLAPGTYYIELHSTN
ncbi:hypothetical protein D1641_05240 [Colidextribacter sp. OB.20]|nr:hypothetical protein [Colidextribacter sp. OB.20]